MARFAQQAFDGISVDRTKGRFSGIFDLEDIEANAAALDEVLVCAVVARVRAITPVVTKGGELEVTKRFDVTDMRVITDQELRDAIVSGCGLYGADTQPTLFDESPPALPPLDGGVKSPGPLPPTPPPAFEQDVRGAQELLAALDGAEEAPEDGGGQEDDTVVVGNVRPDRPEPRKEEAAFLAFMEGA